MSKGSRERRKLFRQIQRMIKKNELKKVVPAPHTHLGDPYWVIPQEYNPQYYSLDTNSGTANHNSYIM